MVADALTTKHETRRELGKRPERAHDHDIDAEEEHHDGTRGRDVGLDGKHHEGDAEHEIDVVEEDEAKLLCCVALHETTVHVRDEIEERDEED